MGGIIFNIEQYLFIVTFSTNLYSAIFVGYKIYTVFHKVGKNLIKFFSISLYYQAFLSGIHKFYSFFNHQRIKRPVSSFHKFINGNLLYVEF